MKKEFIKKSIELLSSNTPYLTIKIYEANSPDISIGTLGILTEDKFFGESSSIYSPIIDKGKEYFKSNISSVSEKIEISSERWAKVLFEKVIEDEILLVGGGHVALAIYNLAVFLNFKVKVIDDRKEFATKERFPLAKEVILKPFSEALKSYKFTSQTYVILVTRGHIFDYECLKIILKEDNLKYIGMICSQRRKRFIFEKLKKEGFSEKKLDLIYAPIGLPIGAETPEEIAISVMGEIISVKRKGNEWTRKFSELWNIFKK